MWVICKCCRLRYLWLSADGRLQSLSACPARASLWVRGENDAFPPYPWRCMRGTGGKEVMDELRGKGGTYGEGVM